LAVFALSSFVPTQRFGALMFTLLTAALIGNLIMLPCVLASPAAFFFGRRLTKKAAAEHRIYEDVSTEEIAVTATPAEAAGPQALRQNARRDSSHHVRS
jgi:hypothetical protein